MKTELLDPLNTQIDDLRAVFPAMWFKPGAEFSPEYEGCIWTGEGSRVYEPELDMQVEVFDYSSNYHMVYPLFYSYCRAKNLSVEWIDRGTVMLWPNNGDF